MFAKRRKIGRFYLLLMFVSLLFVVNRYLFSFLPTVNTVASIVSYPILLVQRAVVVPVQTFFKQRKHQKKLEMLLADFKKKNHELRAENIKLRSCLAYSSNIAELIDFKKRYESSGATIAQVIVRHLDAQRHFLFINRGSRHGIQTDMVAVKSNGLVGRITEVYPFYSKLVPITSTSCKVAACCSRTGASGIHVGANVKQKTTLERVSHLSSVKEGDFITSSGEGLVFPRGFALGIIKDVQPGGLHHIITLEPLVDIGSVDYCVVMKKGEACASTSAS